MVGVRGGDGGRGRSAGFKLILTQLFFILSASE